METVFSQALLASYIADTLGLDYMLIPLCAVGIVITLVVCVTGNNDLSYDLSVLAHHTVLSYFIIVGCNVQTLMMSTFAFCLVFIKYI